MAISKAIADARLYFPEQGPLEFFVHHNPLHSFENIPFHVALEKAKALYGAKVFKSEDEYLSDFINKKIAKFILEKSVLKHFQNQSTQPTYTDLNFELVYRIMTYKPIKKIFSYNSFEENTYSWLNPLLSYKKSKKYFDIILKNEFEIDIDEYISPILLRFFSMYFDQGWSYWKMPNRNDGLFLTFCNFFKFSSFMDQKWKKNLSKIVNHYNLKDSHSTLRLATDNLKIVEEDLSHYFFNLAYRYKGWGALISSLERNPQWNKCKEAIPSFKDFLAILMLCEWSFIDSLPQEHKEPVIERKYIFEKNWNFSENFINRILELSKNLDANENEKLIKTASFFTDQNRLAIWHHSFEETFYTQFLNAFQKAQIEPPQVRKSTYQVICCIDDREESFRRYIEETSSLFETFGVAGHFGLDMEYKGHFQFHSRSLCPNFVQPTLHVSESLKMNGKLKKLIGIWGDILWLQSTSSKSLIRDWYFNILLGFFSAIPTAISILSPSFAAKIKNRVKLDFHKSTNSKINLTLLENKEELSVNSKTQYAYNLLKTMGLTNSFASVIFILGHGSNSLNNPHEAAHDCGACGGGRGGPNARTIAKILNNTNVRKNLKIFSIYIPLSTRFIGGYHNTCSNEVSYFDLPNNSIVNKGIEVINKATQLDAKEKARRYLEMPTNITEVEAYKQMKGRAQDYRQPRPEYGHATNALCVIGPRHYTQSLFLDRRAFLVSYKPEQDIEGSTLRNILSAVGPVCSGINLEYYFSYTDNNKFGCGTKLPHNVNGLLGVMNGYQSDLLIGLPWQMVEIHDPYRLLIHVISKKSVLLEIIDSLPSFNKLVKNGWIELSIYDLNEKKIFRYDKNNFIECKLNLESVPIYKSNKEAFNNNRLACSLGLLRS